MPFPSVGRLAATLLCGCTTASLAQLSNPLTSPFPSGIRVAVENWVTIPASSNSAPVARINHLKPGPDGSRLFCNDLNGRLWVIASNSATSATQFLNLASAFPSFISSPGLGTGFTSFAFHPDFLDSASSGYGKFYTAHSEAANGTAVDFSGPISAATSQVGVVTEWTLNDPAASSVNLTTPNFTRRTLLRIGFPYDYHDVQEIEFNPTATPGDEDYGCLFICIGDGGSIVKDSPANLGRIDSPLGSILRIAPVLTPDQDPADFTLSSNGNYYLPSGSENANPYIAAEDPTPGDGYPVVREVYANGFRNPHRITWDHGGTHKMLCGNIGESLIEEVELVEKGRNYGWPWREGSFAFTYTDKTHVYPLPSPDTAGYTYPVAQYDHASGYAIAGGSVYRGSAIPELQGYYLFGDIVNGRIWIANEADMSLQTSTSTGEAPAQPLELGLKVGSTTTTFLSILGTSRADLRFGTDHDGEIYLLSKQNGRIYKVKQDTSPTVTPPSGELTDWTSIGEIESGSTSGFTTTPAASGSFSIVNDPLEGPVNRVLRLQAHGSASALTASIAVPEIPDDSYGTLFFRFYIPGQDHNITFGLSDVANPTAYADYEMQMRSYLNNGRLQVRSGGSFIDGAPIESGTWYSVWSQVNNATGTSGDTWNLYVQGGSLTTPTLVRSDIAFRNGTTASLKRFLWILSAITASGEAQNGQEIYFDDLFVDVGHANLTNPVSTDWQQIDQFEGASLLASWDVPNAELQSATIEQELSGNHYLRHAASPNGATNQAAILAKKLPFTTQVSQTLTLFLRMKIEGTETDHSVGVSALNPTDPASYTYGDFETELRVATDGEVTVYDGPAGANAYVPTTAPLTSLATGTWQKVWLVGNNGGFASGGQTWTAYAQALHGGDPVAITPTLFFRKGAENPITHFVATASNLLGGNDAICIDDLFASRGKNLTDPVGNEGLPMTLARQGTDLQLAWPSVTNQLFQTFESDDLAIWSPLSEPIEGDGSVWEMDESITGDRRFFKALALSRRAFHTAQWSTDFPSATLPDGMTLVRSNTTVSWSLSPQNLQLTNSASSTVTGMVGRPGGYALAPGDWRNVTLTVEGRSLATEATVNRDLSLIFGYVDDTHFYYAHLSRNSDGSLHTVIMKVNGNTRNTIHVPIPTGTTAGPLVSSSTNPIWHTLRITHSADGAIAAYVDDMDNPVLTAQDTTYPSGRVGCGTFDDPAIFRAMTVEGERP
ncbi:hypothetical protein HNR46_003890 [Haloferula luteola]|uniref:Glucose/Sorbosone dehydrogenase domain-containing protein n=1 Tax=Haloferula luteola TaxID=595692 RepID=A0A840VIL1_9BACT|nr:PQQ-dependent sugar dehydrogenase [Haloferula luteola]MBB5353629.1 hypothetical protein [Haloferula luteola]